jgi:transcriptional regulator GlxA family with amidase domain
MKPARIAVLAFPDAQVLDVTGPLEVFSRTARWLADEGVRSLGPSYEVEVLGERRGRLVTSSGISLYAERAIGEVRGGLDTLLVAGGRGTKRACEDVALLGHLRRLERNTRRFGSVCTGAWLLASAGLLEGRRATTHWRLAAELAAAFPGVSVDADAIFVRDGHLCTSAGVTAGIDLALALVEEDHGRNVALGVARELVVFARRPGGQSQFSVQLGEQFAERDAISDLQRWALEHPSADLSVEACAKRAGMSPRNFARVFRSEVGSPPGVWVETMRVERARGLLEETDRSVEDVAARCGIGSAETLRRAFLRCLKVAPSAYRARFKWRSDQRAES